MELGGIHHLTAITADAPGNHAFYTQALGLRLVKKTVNQDDVRAYHLFYGDGAGSPGSDITFFDWPVGRERRGTGSITGTGLRVAGRDTLAWWEERLERLAITHGGVVERDGRAVLDLEDPEGLRLSLFDDGGAGEAHPWERSPVPAKHQIRGLGPITLTVGKPEPTHRLLTEVLNMRAVRRYETGGVEVQVYEMGAGGAGAELHVAADAGQPAAGQGAGGCHHVAFRTPDGTIESWVEQLRGSRVANSGKIDRHYFQSLYFREPNGILFEIATDGPGFTVDEPLDSLGESLSLPPFLEPSRPEIEANLKPL